MPADAFHTGPPAFVTLLPDMPGEEPVSAAFAARVSQYCGFTADVRALGPSGPGDAGRFVVRGDAQPALFLKVFDERILALQQHSARVAAHLDADGVAVARPLPGEPRPFAPGLSAELFPFIDARFCRPDRDELAQLGAVLARTHRSLAAFDGAAAVKSAGGEMHRRLVAAAESILDGWNPHAGLADDVRAAARGYLHGSAIIRRSPQMIHGDYNYTNVLVDKHSGTLYTIDFEESRAAWLAPVFDVAKVIERFVIVPSRADAEESARACLGAYAAAGVTLPPANLVEVLIASNDRALMIMADKAKDGLTLPDAEWHKFIGLKRLVQHHAPMLDRLSAVRPA